MTTRSRGGICCSLVTAALLALPTALPAQVADSSYSIVALTAPRPENVIRSGIENARADEQEAARSLDRLKDARDRVDARLRVQKADIDAIQSRASLARKDGRDADRADLELKRKQAELDRKVLEEIKSLYDDQVAEMSAKREWAQARGKAFDAELELTRRRQERTDRATADSTALGRLDTAIQEAEGKMLDARKDEASKQAEWALHYRDSVGQQIAVYRAQQAARAGVKR